MKAVEYQTIFALVAYIVGASTITPTQNNTPGLMNCHVPLMLFPVDQGIEKETAPSTSISLSDSKTHIGGKISVTISATSGHQLRAISLIAIRSNDSDNEPVGKFIVENDNTQYDSLECRIHSQNTSHLRSAITVTWLAPSYSGVFTFRANILQNGHQKIKESYKSVTVTDRTPNSESPQESDFIPSKDHLTTDTIMTSTAIPKPPPFPYNYKLCGKRLSCIGGPTDCIINENCKTLMTFYATPNNTVVFDLISEVDNEERYVAMALSNDKIMGTDSVIECLVHNDVKATITVHASTNAPRTNQIASNENSNYFSNVTKSYKDGILRCGFERPFVTTVNHLTTDLQTSKYFVFLAIGPLTDDGKDIRYHTHRMTSEIPVNLSTTDCIIVNTGDSPAPVQVKIHGIFMIAAWIGTACLSIFVARYCRDWKFGNIQCLTWFTIHRGLNVATALLSIVSFVLIFAFAGMSGLWQEHAHPSVGTVSFIFMFIQIIYAYFRPNPNAPRRILFNKIHYIIGILSFIIAYFAILLSVELKSSHLPKYTYWILAAFAFFFAIMYLILQRMIIWKPKQISVKPDGFQIATEEDNPSKGKNFYKTFPVVLTLTVIVMFTIALIVITAMG